jgi:uncharacterized protein (DUF924 family)
MWWSKNADVDEAIRERFEETIKLAASDQLNHWLTEPHGRLALILLTDQFPRNIYRGTAKAFEFDAKALAWSLDGIDSGCDRQLRPIERTFFYLPLEHSESLAYQERSVALFRNLVQDVEDSRRGPFLEYLDFAERHRDVIKRFGRFPHRNAILGRESTLEELAFLKEPGSSF